MSMPEENDLVEPDADDFEEDSLTADLDPVDEVPDAPEVDTQDPGDEESKTTKKAAAKKTASKKSEEDDS